MVKILFENQTTNGDSITIDIKDGGFRLLKVTGNLDSGTITTLIDYRDDDFAPLILENAEQTITILGVVNIQPLKAGSRLKLNLVGAGGSADVTAKLLG